MIITEGLKLLLNYAVIAGLIQFAAFALLYFLGINPMGPVSWLTVFVPILLSYKGLKDFRDKILDGELTYGRGFKTSISLGFFYASFSGLLVYFFGLTLATDLVEIQKQEVLKGLELARGYFDNDKIFDKALEEVENLNIGRLAWGDFQNKLIGMIILGLIMAGVLKKEKPLFDKSSSNEQN